MSKLRLIKPWHLQTVHQRLEAVHNEEPAFSLVPCTGPSGDYIEDTDLRKNVKSISVSKSHAPVSDVIFAAGNDNIR